MHTVRVLMAAYNGEKYIRGQMDSILSQKGVQVSLLARDDGSCDRTGEILAAYAHKYKNVSVYKGKNRGAARSFYDLLAQTDMGADDYAFADQDDIWQEDKLMRALELMEECKRPGDSRHLPLLYAGKVVCASRDLKKKEMFSYRICREASFGNALVENICMGCTQVFNRPLLRLVREHLPQENIMHDWWLYLTAACFGRVVYDQEAHMLYRQHGNNQIGMQNRWCDRWKHRLRYAGQLKHKLSGQAAEFWKAYEGVLSSNDVLDRQPGDRCGKNAKNQNRLYGYKANADILEQLCTYRSSFSRRVRMAADKRIYRQNKIDDLLYRLLFLTGYL